MPAGPRILYYGLGLTTKEAFALLDPAPFIVDDDGDKYLDCGYLDALEKMLEEKDFGGAVVQYGNALSLNPEDLDKVSVVYGFEVIQFEIYTEVEFDNDVSEFQDDLMNFRDAYKLEKRPKYYCVYTGD